MGDNKQHGFGDKYFEKCKEAGLAKPDLTGHCFDDEDVAEFVDFYEFEENDLKLILGLRRRRLVKTSPAGSTQPRVASTNVESVILVFLIVPILFLFYVFASPQIPKRD